MRFRTEIELQAFSAPIEHDDPILTIGSCFADNIAKKFSEYRFNLLANPFGVLYNPASVYFSLQLLTKGDILNEDSLVQFGEVWHSFYHHSSFSYPDKKKALQRINHSLEITRNYLKHCKYIFITYGSSYYYTYKKSGKIVSNCHKIPGTEFNLDRLSVEQVYDFASRTATLTHQINSNCHLIFTVSPVRYLKYGFTGNQLSKATLLLGLEKTTRSNPLCYYFPAYEMVLDDLRDYRYYNDDLVQPGPQAIEFIWEKLQEHYLSAACRKIIPLIDSINKAKNHKPFNPHSKEHQAFIKKQLDNLDRLEDSVPHVDWHDDRIYFKSQLI